MEFFKKVTTINFMGLRKWTVVLSSLLFLSSVLSLAIHGLNWGLDFTGGTQIQVTFNKPVEIGQVRTQLEHAGYTHAIVQSYGTVEDVLINIPPQQENDQRRLGEQVVQALPGATLKRVEFVGPQVGQELASKGALAVLVALIGIMIYITFRFEYRFAVGAAIALVHDPVLILGIFSFFHLEFNLTALAAVLAVIGYSLNESVVIFDRVRENFRKIRKGTPIEIVNLSINQTLSRTVITAGAALAMLLSLFFFGGAMIHEFAIAFIIGIVTGTYSSIFVAGALALALGLDRKGLLPTPKQALDDRP